MASQKETSNFSVNGRTISLRSDFDRVILGDYADLVTVTTADSGRVFVECGSIDDATVLFDTFKDNDMKPRIVSYSLFFRSQEELTEDEARSIFSGMTEATIVYMRVDPNGHTGKLVVDTLADYRALKAYDDDTIQFFHFDPKARNRRRNKNRDDDQDDGEVEETA